MSALYKFFVVGENTLAFVYEDADGKQKAMVADPFWGPYPLKLALSGNRITEECFSRLLYEKHATQPYEKRATKPTDPASVPLDDAWPADGGVAQAAGLIARAARP